MSKIFFYINKCIEQDIQAVSHAFFVHLLHSQKRQKYAQIYAGANTVAVCGKEISLPVQKRVKLNVSLKFGILDFYAVGLPDTFSGK